MSSLNVRVRLTVFFSEGYLHLQTVAIAGKPRGMKNLDEETETVKLYFSICEMRK